ncbi:N-acetyltransferase [Thermosulfuriphilus ammonigenes]|uniref:N-acetyltransferase n=1 Tax=Thermosulfuriphilus ammonigenes TaxID=1936021 RepID=A0A6G7PWW4_9BACT|nr:N-acetyltransferase [Thermosulfuriphilus ammonigenes]MBA2847902.1 amino-acid N-acetyltransferase [Thermosulfuriphilus ammonigenes]QIJ71903.1 N-acetyltransferase [Thermosulfuriphilus ammonigenes]
MIRKAKISDIRDIHRLITHFSRHGSVLQRPLSELYEYVRDFFVFIPEGETIIAGTCALHVTWEDLAEIRSLTVAEEYQGLGVGEDLIEHCLAEARELGLRRVFVLTNVPDYFQRLGFFLIDKGTLPHKVWADCVKCLKFPDCDEVAMIKEIK